jgi:hypothetical protein
MDTIPQLYQAGDGPFIQSFHFGDLEARRCSLRELGPPLLQYVDKSLKGLADYCADRNTSLPSVMHYERVQQVCASLWLETQTGISTWDRIIDYFLRTQKRTIENWAIAKSFVIDPSPLSPSHGVSSRKIDFLDPRNQRLIDWLATSPFTFFRVTPELEFIAYEAVAHRPVDFSPDYIPDFLWPMASQVSDATQFGRPILVDSNQRGDLLISDRQRIIAARIKSRWTVYDQITLESAIYHCLKQGETIRDSQSLKQLAHTLFRILFDVSFKRHGGLIIVDEDLARVRKYASGGVFVDDASDFTKIIPTHSFGERSPDVTAVRKLIELTSIDGAILLSSSGLMLGYGAMIRPHPAVGDSSGARTLAAKSAARHGAIAFSVSADGEILSYFQTKKYSGDSVHQMRL